MISALTTTGNCESAASMRWRTGALDSWVAPCTEVFPAACLASPGNLWSCLISACCSTVNILRMERGMSLDHGLQMGSRRKLRSEISGVLDL